MGDGKRGQGGTKKRGTGERKNVQIFVSAAVRSKVRRYDSKMEAERDKVRKKGRKREMNDWPRQVARARIAR